jgi:hypothetical protein
MAIPVGNLRGSFDFSNISSYPGTGNTLYDLSGTGNTLTNTVLTGTFGGTGQSKYYSFAGGSDQFGKFATSGLAGTALFTASAFAWVRSSNWNSPAQDGGYHYLLAWGEDVAPGGGHIGFAKQVSSTYYPSGAMAMMGSGWGATFFPGGLTNNDWLHLGYVATGTNCNLYLNGTLVGTIPQQNQGANPPYFGPTGTNGYVGNSGYGGYTPWMCLGALAEAGYAPASNFDIATTDFYDVSLSDAQALELYNSQVYRFTGGPPPPPPFPSAIAEYDFSNVASYPGTGGTIYDLSGTGNTLTNTTLTGTFGGTGQSKFYTFAGGSDQFYRNDSSGIAGTQLYTASQFMWVRSTDWNDTGNKCLAGWGEDIGAGGGQIGIWKNIAAFGGLTRAWGSMGSGVASTAFPTTLTANTWIHIGYTIDGTNAKLYIDGVEVGSVAQNFAWPSGTGLNGFISNNSAPYFAPITLGGLYYNYYPASAFDIAIAEFYNVGLGSTEVLQLYNSQEARFAGGPAPYVGSVGGRRFGGRFAG